jgi:exonuclease SbcC
MYREEGRRKTLVEAEHALREELDRLRARFTVIEKAPAQEEEVTLELEKKRSELEDAQGDLEARRTEWVRDRQDADTKLRDLRKQYLELQEQRERVISLGADRACPTCSRKLGENLQTVVEHLTETVETLRVDGAYYKSRFEQLSEMPANVKDLDERRRALTAETGALERKLARVQLAVQELTGLTRDIAAKERRLEAMRRDISVIARGFDAEKAKATMVYQPNSMVKSNGGRTRSIQVGTSAGRKAANTLAYQIAVLGLLSCVARPMAKLLRQPLPVGCPSFDIASGVAAPRQIRKPR